MVFEEYRRERMIRRVLNGLARQRVALIAQPGNIWVIERALPRFDGYDEALLTCHMRGWVEQLEKAVPFGTLNTDGMLNPNDTSPFHSVAPIYRLTEAGWAAVNRTHAWLVATFTVTTVTLIATILGIWITWVTAR